MNYQSWNEWKNRRLIESKGQSPNYAFDNWLKMTKKFGDEVSSFVSQAREKDKELDDEMDKKKKDEPLEKDNKDVKADDDSKTKETAWEKLRNIAKERMKKDKKEEGSKSSSRS